MMVQIDDAKNNTTYAMLNNLDEAPSYIDKNMDAQLGPYKFKALLSYKANFDVLYIGIDSGSHSMYEFLHGTINYMSLYNYIKVNYDFSEKEINDQINAVFTGKKLVFKKNRLMSYMVINPNGECNVITNV